MDIKKAIKLLKIERRCVLQASGLIEAREGGYKNDPHGGCDRDCEHCGLVQETKDLIDMYDYVIEKLVEEQ